MNWKHAFTSAVGKKFIMGGTGISLVLFLFVHAYVNFQIFLPDGREKFLDMAHFLGTNLLMHILEIGLLVFFILHVVQGLMLERANRAKRPVGYDVKPGNKNTKWYVRSMGILGSLILIFLIVHLAHFWVPNRYNQITTGEEIDLYLRMWVVFQNIGPVIIYTIGCLALAWHLAHGFWSAFHSLGLSPWKYKSIIQTVGYIIAIIIPLVFILMPLAFYFHWLPAPPQL